jgi:O-antigen ligase
MTEIIQLLLSAVTSLALMAGMLLTWGDELPNLFRREPIPIGLAIATLGLVKLQPGLILTLVSGIILFIIIYNRLDIGLTLTIFWAPFFLFPVQLYTFVFPLAEITLLLTALAWFIRGIAAWGQYRQINFSHVPLLTTDILIRRIKPLDWCVIAWLALGLIALTWSEQRPPAITEFRTMILEPVLFYTIWRTTISDHKVLRRLLDTMLLAGFLVAVIGLGQFLQGQAIITAEGGVRRLASVYGSPNNVGLFLGRCFPFVLAFCFVKTDRIRRIAAAVCLAAMGVAIILSQSVGAIIIGVPIASIIVVMLIWGKRARWALILMTVTTIVVFLISLQSARFARVLEFDTGTNFFRIRAWQSAVNMIRDHPITGLGLDQFLYAFRGHYIMPDAWQEPNLSHPHNIVLDFWIRLGIFGVILLLGTLATFFRLTRKLYQRYRNSPHVLDFAFLVGSIGSMVNLLAHGLIDNSVYVQDLAYVFVLLLAVIVHYSNTGAIDATPL